MSPSPLLDATVRDHPELTSAVALLGGLLSAMHTLAGRPLPAGVPDRSGAAARLRQGIPALVGERLLDGRTLGENLGVFAGSLAGTAGAERAMRVHDVTSTRVDGGEMEELARAAVAGAWDVALVLAARHELDRHAVVTMLDFAARPALRAAAAVIAGMVAGAHWDRGLCPGCGAAALLVEQRSGDATRVLRCGRCASEWLYPAGRCPSCGDDDALARSPDDAAAMGSHVEACERCGSYVKVLLVTGRLDGDELLEQDIATSRLDVMAAGRGYHR